MDRQKERRRSTVFLFLSYFGVKLKRRIEMTNKDKQHRRHLRDESTQMKTTREMLIMQMKKCFIFPPPIP